MAPPVRVTVHDKRYPDRVEVRVYLRRSDTTWDRKGTLCVSRSEYVHVLKPLLASCEIDDAHAQSVQAP